MRESNNRQGRFDFDPDASRAAAEAAIEQVTENADEDWMEEAQSILRSVCYRQQFFTTDDVWVRLDPKTCATHEPRAMGGVMRWGQTEGLCRNTGTFRKTARIVAHHRPLAVWESLVFRKPAQSEQTAGEARCQTG